jgi:hypothetical protein
MAENEEGGWKLTETETQLRDAKESGRRVLIVIEPDGYMQAFADDGVMVKIVNVFPWQDAHELMLADRTHWKEIWWPGKVRTTAMPKYVVEPERFTPEALAAMQRFKTNVEVLGAIKDLGETLRAAKTP